MNQRLHGLQSFQKRDVDPNATENELWQRFNNLEAENVNNDLNPYKAPLQSNQPGSANANLPEHQADALLNQMADQVYLEKASRAEGVHHSISAFRRQFTLHSMFENNTKSKAVDFDVDDELDSVEEDPALYALLKEVELNQDTAPPQIPANWANGLALSENDDKVIQGLLDEVPKDILAASSKAADKEYEAMRRKEKLYTKMGKMGVDPDEYLDEIMGDSDDSGSDDGVADDRVNRLIQMAQDEVALEGVDSLFLDLSLAVSHQVLLFVV